MTFEAGVPAPIRGGNVHASVAIEVAGGHTIPPAGQLTQGLRTNRDRRAGRERQRRIPGNQSAVLVAENLQRPPFAGEDQVRIAVAIQITEHRATHQAHARQGSRVLDIKRPLIPCPAEEKR